MKQLQGQDPKDRIFKARHLNLMALAALVPALEAHKPGAVAALKKQLVEQSEKLVVASVYGCKTVDEMDSIGAVAFLHPAMRREAEAAKKRVEAMQPAVSKGAGSGWNTWVKGQGQGQGQGAASQSKWACLICGQLGHFKKDCTQREGKL